MRFFSTSNTCLILCQTLFKLFIQIPNSILSIDLNPNYYNEPHYDVLFMTNWYDSPLPDFFSSSSSLESAPPPQRLYAESIFSLSRSKLELILSLPDHSEKSLCKRFWACWVSLFKRFVGLIFKLTRSLWTIVSSKSCYKGQDILGMSKSIVVMGVEQFVSVTSRRYWWHVVTDVTDTSWNYN